MTMSAKVGLDPLWRGSPHLPDLDVLHRTPPDDTVQALNARDLGPHAPAIDIHPRGELYPSSAQ